MTLSNSNVKRSTSNFGEFNQITKKLFQSLSPRKQKKRNNTSFTGKKSTLCGVSSSGGRIKIYKSLLPKVKCLIIIHEFLFDLNKKTLFIFIDCFVGNKTEFPSNN